MTARAPQISLTRLRSVILAALIIGVAVFTGVMLRLVTSLSDRFGPQVREDLEWRALRGVAELSHTADLGVAVSDEGLVREAIAPQVSSADVMGVVAMNADGAIVASFGDLSLSARMFSGTPDTVKESPGVLLSWAPAKIEGAVVGKIGIAISTARLTQTEELLSSVADATMIACGVVLVFGVFGVFWFIRAVAVRDSQLRHHAATLEQRVVERTRELDQRNGEMRLVLDNVSQGLITLDCNGVIGGEQSAIVEKWFGPPPASRQFIDYVGDHSPELAASIMMGLDMLRDAALPTEVILDQMARRFSVRDREMTISFIPIMRGETVEQLLAIVSDITDQLASERAEKEQREVLAVFQRVARDRSAGREFLVEGDVLMASVAAPGERVLQARAIHTLKGNCGLFGFTRFAELCHEIEDELADRQEPDLDVDQCHRLVMGWTTVVSILRSLIGHGEREIVEIDRGDVLALAERARRGARVDEIASVLTSWTFEPVAQRFERLGEQAQSLAQRLDKGPLAVNITDHGIRLESTRWSSLWPAMTHLIRNAIDHGIESADARAAGGKGSPSVTFTAARIDQALVFSVADDGRGIEWDAIRQRAMEHGLPSASHEDLVAALFADGLSSRDVATEVSGRGVGLAALFEAVELLGGSIGVESEPGRGSRFEMRFPADSAAVFAAAAVRPRTVTGGKEPS
ncbi:MAG TPA: ATP-binding protein [Kofleriaceae bacterium]|jgi:two-component system chemotaxis sensor kinase CheA